MEPYAYEFKWSAHKRATIPSAFKEAYPSAIEAIITQENWDQFLLGRL